MGKMYSLALVLFASLVFASCAQKLNFGTSVDVPAAKGKVKIKKDNNENYLISVKIENLVEAKELTPSRDVYVVWMETDRDGTKNIGQVVPEIVDAFDYPLKIFSFFLFGHKIWRCRGF